MDWVITVNKNEMTMTHPTVVDTLPAGWEFVTSSVAVTQNDATVPCTPGFSPDRRTLTLALPDMERGAASAKPYLVRCTIRLVDDSLLYNTSADTLRVENTARLTADEIPSAGQEVRETATVDAPMLTKTATNKASAKHDGYLALEVMINKGLASITAPSGADSLVLRDTLEPNLALDLDSVSLRRVNVSASGTVTDGARLSSGIDYAVTYNSGTREFLLDFKAKNVSSAYKLTFHTDFVALTNGDYENSIHFGGMDDPVQSAESGAVVMNFSGERTQPRVSYGRIAVNKTDADGLPLAGAVFTLTKDGSVNAMTATTAAPKGYAMPAVHEWRVTVAANGQETFTVVNDKIPDPPPVKHGVTGAPDTGDTGRPALWASLTGLSAGAAGLVLYRRGKKREKSR